MIISKTPFRVSFFGGGTDYPSWYHTHGGAVLSTTINKYTEGVDKLMTSRHLCAIRLHERKTAMP